MARISTDQMASPTDQHNAELTSLIDRLQKSILHVRADRERWLRTSALERAKEEHNLAYARSVLTKLERESMALKAHTLRQEVQSDLNKKREDLEVLMDRLQDLGKMGALQDDVEEDTDSQDEDILGEIIPTPSESMESTSADHSVDPWEQEQEPEHLPEPDLPEPQPAAEEKPTPAPAREPSPTQAATTTSPADTPIPTPPPTSTSQSLRPRRQPSQSARATLLSRSTSSQHAHSATAEALLDRQRAEQDTLVEGILGYASALKDSSQRFNESLEKDRVALERAADSMDRAGTGMESAKRGMGVLTRMTEGKGWWGRMLLFAWVYGLMLGLVLLVFVVPKLRF
ncbi:uncharacterized protein DNG_05666 [Cephalotrichum gorgonifer]|uniref:Synaptobrevin n=1 Tax=Cephalotrichum gorgonifer TaxID=2041049 RepID=A0AAE8SVP1_9PEZI|nr:uncharacterized protein DNG_05666 [Cephalotrichum gorgonifer]